MRIGLEEALDKPLNGLLLTGSEGWTFSGVWKDETKLTHHLTEKRERNDVNDNKWST